MRETADLFDQTTGAWVGVIDLNGREQLLDSVVYVGTWANRPLPTAVGVGSQMITTDIGSFRIWWYSDGTYWRPLNGRAGISTQYGTVAAPLATLTATGAIQTAALPIIPSIPPNMLIPGARVCTDVRGLKTGATASHYFGAGIGPTQNPGAALAPILLGGAMPAQSGAAGPSIAYAQVLSATKIASPSYTGTGFSSAGYSEATIDLTVTNYVNVQVNNQFASPDTLAIFSVNVWLEF